MALFNKLFSSRKNNCYKTHRDGDKRFCLDKQQVRLILFRECDFRGRKLLFDSNCVERISPNLATTEPNNPNNKFQYRYNKQPVGTGQLSELIFGSVAMSYKGTSFKIHRLKSPDRLMFSQIFPSPRYRMTTTCRRCNLQTQSSAHSCSSNSSLFSLERSIKLDDSGASSSANSVSEHSYNNLQIADSWCSNQDASRTTSCATSPPELLSFNLSNVSSTNYYLTGTNQDSGFSGEKSCTSVSSGPQSLPLSVVSLEEENFCNNGALYHKCWQNNRKSIDFQARSINFLSSDDCLYKSNNRISKLGLAVIIELSEKQDSSTEQFLMEHSILIDLAMWRIRHNVESAYLKQTGFTSHMYNITEETTLWLLNLLSGPRLNTINLWNALVPSFCDNVSETSDASRFSSGTIHQMFHNFNRCSDAFDFPLFNLARYLKSELASGGGMSSADCMCKEKNFAAEKCVSEFCELLNSIDVKQTNFFMSTLITAVLTHHLGWVATVLPSFVDNSQESSTNSANPFWVHFAPLYGAVGQPSKIAHTLITGKGKPELISKILNSLTYFIRCGKETRRKFSCRVEMLTDNDLVDRVCSRNALIPNVNYKKYMDHLEDLNVMQGDQFLTTQKPATSSLYRVLSGTFPQSSKPFQDHLLTPVIEQSLADTEFTLSLDQAKSKNKCDGVVFVLGDDDQLVGLKKSSDNHIDSKVVAEDNVVKNKAELEYSDEFVSLKLGNSWSSHMTTMSETPAKILSNARSKSEPPPPTNLAGNSNKLKYSGVKFNIRRYPQIVTNYMKSKNLEMARWSVTGEKSLALLNLDDENSSILEGTATDSHLEEFEILQTPSNASELAFTSTDGPIENVKEKTALNNLPFESRGKVDGDFSKLKIAILPFPKSKEISGEPIFLDYRSSLMRGVGERYLSDMVLQGICSPREEWESKLRRDLVLASRHSLVHEQIDEAVAIVANTDTWDVQLVSSHTHLVDQGCLGLRVGMSQLVANMLDSLLQMWKLHVPLKYCVMHIEQSLQEVFLLSKALVELLLATEFCSIELLTSVLHLEVNDIPLLMAVASTYSPQVTQKYGLSFR